MHLRVVQKRIDIDTKKKLNACLNIYTKLFVSVNQNVTYY